MPFRAVIRRAALRIIIAWCESYYYYSQYVASVVWLRGRCANVSVALGISALALTLCALPPAAATRAPLPATGADHQHEHAVDGRELARGGGHRLCGHRCRTRAAPPRWYARVRTAQQCATCFSKASRPRRGRVMAATRFKSHAFATPPAEKSSPQTNHQRHQKLARKEMDSNHASESHSLGATAKARATGTASAALRGDSEESSEAEGWVKADTGTTRER